MQATILLTIYCRPQAASIHAARMRERKQLAAAYALRRAKKAARMRLYADGRQHVRAAAKAGALPEFAGNPPVAEAASAADGGADSSEADAAEDEAAPAATLPILIKADVQAR